jgi:hypothetical protein
MVSRMARITVMMAMFFLILHSWAQDENECWLDKSESAPERYECYVNAHLCNEERTDGCLRETAFLATRSGGRQVLVRGVYSWHDSGLVQGMEYPHFLLQYMRLLRNAYNADPSTYLNQLYNQIEYLVSDAHDRNGALVWENKYGIAQGMEQAEYAEYFSSVAGAYRNNGELKLARGTMDYALMLIRALDMPAGVHTGGVASGEFYCGSKRARFRPCCWFHSRGRGIDLPGVQTVLNQHLHVIRDVLSMYLNVMNATDLVSPEFGTPEDVLDRLEDRAIAGLYQLAFTVGNTSIQRSRPPNISQFMNFREQITVKPTAMDPSGNPKDYYWAYYEFDMNRGKGKNISHKNTCSYHTHTLKVMADIKYILDSYPVFRNTANGWRLYEAMDALFQGKNEPTGMKGSVNAIYQFFHSERPVYKIRREGCYDCGSLSDRAYRIYSSLFD